jgi:hypothetical protein
MADTGPAMPQHKPPGPAASNEPLVSPPPTEPGGHDEVWEPGLPPLRAIAPSAIGGAVVPLAVFYLVRSHVSSDAVALAIAGIPAAIWVTTQWIRRRTLDPIGAIVLSGFVVGLIVSYALGGNAFVLKVRDSAFTFFFGVGSLVTARFGKRPLTFYIGRALTAGSDPHRAQLYNELWEVPPAQATFRVINLAWGVALVCDAAARVLLAANLSTKTFVAISPVTGLVFIGGMSVFTFWLVRRSRHWAPLVPEADIPPGGGSTWWWLRVYLKAPSGLQAQHPPGA